jgi:hypothetical protein
MARRRACIDLVRRGQATHRGTGGGACCGAQQRISTDRAQNRAAGGSDASTRERPAAGRLATGRQRK